MEEKQLTNREWQASREKRKIFDLIVNNATYKCCTYRDEIFIYKNGESQETEEFSYSLLEDTNLDIEEFFEKYNWSSFKEYIEQRLFPNYFIAKELAGAGENKDFSLKLEAMIYIFLAFFPESIDIRKIIGRVEDIKKNSKEVYNDISRLFNYALDGDKPLELSDTELRHILKEACCIDISLSDIEAYCKELNIKILKGDSSDKATTLHPFLVNN